MSYENFIPHAFFFIFAGHYTKCALIYRKMYILYIFRVSKLMVPTLRIGRTHSKERLLNSNVWDEVR